MTRWLRGVVAAAGMVMATGCGASGLDRTASGAGIGAVGGAAAGALVGGLGVLPGLTIGAAAGGLTGFVTTPGQINLGPPLWRR